MAIWDIIIPLLILVIIVVIIVVVWVYRNKLFGPRPIPVEAAPMDQMEQRPMTYYNLDTEFHCPQCDALVSPDAYQCDQCGALFQEGTYACQNCGAQVSPEMLECPECGEIFSQNPTLCPKCGGAVREDARSCDKCGEEFWSPIRPPMEVERGKAKAQPTGSPEMLGNEDFEELPERI